MAQASRDPVSVSLDRAARQLLARVYRARGGWAATRLADPSPAQLARWLAEGINVLGPDPVSGSTTRARTRWARAYVRALWYQHKWYSGPPSRAAGWRPEQRAAMRRPGIQIEVGRHRQQLGVIPAGRPFRVRLADPAAVKGDGRPEETWSWATGARHADNDNRDWPAFG